MPLPFSNAKLGRDLGRCKLKPPLVCSCSDIAEELRETGRGAFVFSSSSSSYSGKFSKLSPSSVGVTRSETRANSVDDEDLEDRMGSGVSGLSFLRRKNRDATSSSQLHACAYMQTNTHACSSYQHLGSQRQSRHLSYR